MAKTKNGVSGSVSGKVGNTVYSSWKGIEVVKSKPVRKAPLSQKQIDNNFVFGLTQAWLRPIIPLLQVGFRDYAPTNQGVTAAKSYIHRHALTKDGLNSSIAPEKMMVSYGPLPSADNIATELTPEKELIFTWDPTVKAKASALDQALLLAYNIKDADANYSLGGDFRKSGTGKLNLRSFTPGDFHLYLAFVSADGAMQSDSVYLGKVTV